MKYLSLFVMMLRLKFLIEFEAEIRDETQFEWNLFSKYIG